MQGENKAKHTTLRNTSSCSSLHSTLYYFRAAVGNVREENLTLTFQVCNPVIGLIMMPSVLVIHGICYISVGRWDWKYLAKVSANIFTFFLPFIMLQLCRKILEIFVVNDLDIVFAKTRWIAFYVQVSEFVNFFAIFSLFLHQISNFFDVI